MKWDWRYRFWGHWHRTDEPSPEKAGPTAVELSPMLVFLELCSPQHSQPNAAALGTAWGMWRTFYEQMRKKDARGSSACKGQAGKKESSKEAHLTSEAWSSAYQAHWQIHKRCGVNKWIDTGMNKWDKPLWLSHLTEERGKIFTRYQFWEISFKDERG